MIPLKTKIRFKNRILVPALQVKSIYGFNELICVTQAAHESNWGESQLSRVADNLFGMTSNKSWEDAKREIYKIQTKEYSKFPPEKIRYWNRPGDIVEKRSDGKGGSILMVEVDFRKYRSWDDSVMDWAEKIASEPRYVNAFFHSKADNPKEFFQALHSAGYATDPDYAQKLLSVYEVVKNLPEEEPKNEDARIV